MWSVFISTFSQYEYMRSPYSQNLLDPKAFVVMNRSCLALTQDARIRLLSSLSDPCQNWERGNRWRHQSCLIWQANPLWRKLGRTAQQAPYGKSGQPFRSNCQNSSLTPTAIKRSLIKYKKSLFLQLLQSVHVFVCFDKTIAGRKRVKIETNYKFLSLTFLCKNKRKCNI